jgi:glycosyltransferase involved in cell wall biosynthesis
VHVGLNLIFLVPGETGGTEVVARELIPALCSASADMRFTAFINQEAAAAGGGPWGELIPSVTVPVHARNRLEWVRGEQLLLPRAAARADVDVVHSLASTGPAWGRFTRVVTIHDLIYHIHPEAHPGLRARGMRVLVPLAARRSHRVMVDSVSTRDDVVNLLKLPGEKVDVVPLGLGSTARAEPLPESELRRQYGLDERPIALSVSAKRPHKNLARLIEALSLIPRERRPALIVPGYPTWHERELRERAVSLGLDGDVRFLDWVSPSELEGLYGAAACFVYPSLYEGFGLPVLEAMQRGVPVACSNRSSLPEVAGHAALTFDPERPAEIAAAMERLLSDAPLASRLRSAGRERAASFSWEATARATVASYEHALAGRRYTEDAR